MATVVMQPCVPAPGGRLTSSSWVPSAPCDDWAPKDHVHGAGWAGSEASAGACPTTWAAPISPNATTAWTAFERVARDHWNAVDLMVPPLCTEPTYEGSQWFQALSGWAEVRSPDGTGQPVVWWRARRARFGRVE